MDKDHHEYAFEYSFIHSVTPQQLPGLENQIRNAFITWGNVLALGYGPTYGFDVSDFNQWGAFIDIQSLALHEIGNALGLANCGPYGNAYAGANYGENYIYAGTGIPSGPLLSTFGSQSGANTEVMNANFASSEYRRILTWDDLNGYAYVYGNVQVTFQEVPYGHGEDTQDRSVQLPWLKLGGSQLAVTYDSGTENGVTAPSTITGSTIYFNTGHNPPLRIPLSRKQLGDHCQRRCRDRTSPHCKSQSG